MTAPRVTKQTVAIGAAFVLIAIALTWLMFVELPRRYGRRPPAPGTAASAARSPESVGRKIKAQLFYVANDGISLSGIERDVTYAEQTVDQAREILNAQIAPAESPLLSAVPAGTVIRALFVTPQGQAFVDLSRDVAVAHPGGSLNELLTIYTIVHALTLNMPAITSVQLLVDGKEVDTLAGHIDLRHPLTRNAELIANPEP